MTCVRSCDEFWLKVGLRMCPFSIVSFYYLSSSLSSGLGTHCSFLSRIHPLSMPWERSCDGFWLKIGLCMCSVSIVSFYYLSLSLIGLSLTPANTSLRSIQFPRSVSVFLVFGLSLSHLLFYLVLVLRFRFRYPVVFVSSPSYTTSLYHLVSVATSQ